MTVKRYMRFELAERQLKTAISILVSGVDVFSAITLAGAADVTFAQLVLNKGEENFTDYSVKDEVQKTGENISRVEHGRAINNALFINALKHLDRGEDEYVDFDPIACAVASILKAIANYVLLVSQEADFVKAFLFWVQHNLDPAVFNIYGRADWKPNEER